MSDLFEKLRAINVNDQTEKKNNLTYLSWAWAWDKFKTECPDASYEVGKNADGLPYFESHAGVMVYTKVTVAGKTHEMWLPVMDGANKSMKKEAYTYKTQYAEKSVEAFSMFDVNKTLMRCLVKNLAMFGFALYIYAGEDLPESEEPAKQPIKPSPAPNLEPPQELVNTHLMAIDNAKSLEELHAAYESAIAKLGVIPVIHNAKNARGKQLNMLNSLSENTA